jgi:hypothetical protein
MASSLPSVDFAGRREIGQFGDPFVQIGESHGQRIYLGMRFIELKRDVIDLVPRQSGHNGIQYRKACYRTVKSLVSSSDYCRVGFGGDPRLRK